jgi:hypothetical protein
MRRALAVLGLVVAAAGLPGCYLSRQVAGDDLVGGPVNPYLWVTVPVDALLSPAEILHFIEQKDAWTPWAAENIRYEYIAQFAFPEDDY